MKISAIILPSLLALSAGVHAQSNIYRCAAPDGVVYRDTPCAASEDETLISAARKIDWQPESPKTESPKANSSPRSALIESTVYANHLFIGMTDTQVLNLPGWGRPAQIVRSKSGRAWRELWVYKDKSTGNERGYLHFENARLVDREDAPVAYPAQVQAAIQ